MHSKLSEKILNHLLSSGSKLELRTCVRLLQVVLFSQFLHLGTTVRYVQVEGICSVISMQLATGAHQNSSHATGGFSSLSTWQQPVWFTADYNLAVLVNSRW